MSGRGHARTRARTYSSRIHRLATGDHGDGRVPVTTIEAVRIADVEAGGRQCRECGCTDNAACPGGCSWVGLDLCSDCVLDVSPEASEA